MKKLLATTFTAIAVSASAKSQLPDDVLIHLTTNNVDNLLQKVDEFSAESVKETPFAIYLQPGMMKNMLPIVTGLPASIVDLKRPAHLFLSSDLKSQNKTGLFLPITDSSKIENLAGVKKLKDNTFELLGEKYVAVCKDNYLVYSDKPSTASAMAKSFNKWQIENGKSELSATIDIPKFHKMLSSQMDSFLSELERELNSNPATASQSLFFKEMVGKLLNLLNDVESVELSSNLNKANANIVANLKFKPESELAKLSNLALNDKLDYSLLKNFEMSKAVNAAIYNNPKLLKAYCELLINLFGSDDKLGITQMLKAQAKGSSMNSGMSFLSMDLSPKMKPEMAILAGVNNAENFMTAQKQAMQSQTAFTNNIYAQAQLPITTELVFTENAGTIDGLSYTLAKSRLEVGEDLASLKDVFAQQQNPPTALIKLSEKHVGMIMGEAYENMMTKLVQDYRNGKNDGSKFINQAAKLKHKKTAAMTINLNKFMKSLLFQGGDFMSNEVKNSIKNVSSDNVITIGVDCTQNQLNEELIIPAAVVRDAIKAFLQIQTAIMQHGMN